MVKGLTLLALGWALSGLLAAPAIAQQKAEASNMALVGYSDLQGRAAYQPFVQKQGERWIAYIGSQSGGPSPLLNSLTGEVEVSGTSIVDVTDPKHPKYIAHIPGGGGPLPGAKLVRGQRPGEGGGQHLRVCSGSDLPHADKGKFYLLRDLGTAAWEIWDVTDPTKPSKMNDVVTGLSAAHRSFWECDTGIAYVAAGLVGWPSPPAEPPREDPASNIVIYDLSDPAKPVLIRQFGLPGQNPGSTTPFPLPGLYNIISTGPKDNRLYITYGNNAYGTVLIVDREKLLNGPKEPTDENLRYPVIARIELPSHMGAHTAIPLPQMRIPAFPEQAKDKVQDFLVLTAQQDGNECTSTSAVNSESRASINTQMVRMFDITDESNPVGVSSWMVPAASGNFCSRGGRFGPHSSQEEFGPIYYKRVLFVSYYNAGVRAVDIRDPYHPTEIGYYIPTINDNFTQERCVGKGEAKRCKKAIQTNNVTVDDRGYIYIVDHASSGMHILELTGPARQVANFTAVGNSASRQ